MSFDTDKPIDPTEESDLGTEETKADAGETPAEEPEHQEQENKEEVEEVVISFQDEAEQAKKEEEQKAPPWVKELRKSHREQQRRIKELEHEIKAKTQPDPQTEVGEKPTLEASDFDVDDFETKLLAWNERKREAEKAVEAKRKSEEEANKAWSEKVDRYNKLKSELKIPDFGEAEAEVTHALNQTQQGILVNYAANPATLVVALGNDEAKLKKLAEIKDPIDFAFAIRDLESKVSVTKKIPPPPEPKVDRPGGISSLDATEARLEADADKSGNRTKLIAYKRERERKLKER